MSDFPCRSIAELNHNALTVPSLIPIRVEFETDAHRIRDCFVWNYAESISTPESFARVFCADLDLPENPWLATVANQIRAQIEEWESVARLKIGMDGAMPEDTLDQGEEKPDCRVILSVRLSNLLIIHHLSVRIDRRPDSSVPSYGPH